MADRPRPIDDQPTLRALDPGPDEAARIVHALLAELCERHDAGLPHGAVRATTVVVDDAGDHTRPARVRLVDADPDVAGPHTSSTTDAREPSGDAAGVARLVHDLRTAWGDGARHHPDWDRLGDVERPLPLRRALAVSQRLATPSRPRTTARRPIGLVVAAIAAVLALLGVVTPSFARAENRAIDGPVVEIGRHRLRVGTSGDVAIVTGQPGGACPEARIVLLESATGRVWRFDDAIESTVTAHAVAVVPGAHELVPRSCSSVLARGAAGTVVVDLGR